MAEPGKGHDWSLLGVWVSYSGRYRLDQLRKTIDNLELILKAAGADLSSIVKLSGGHMLTGPAMDLSELQRFLAREASQPLPLGKGWAGPGQVTPAELAGQSPAHAGFSLPLMVVNEKALHHDVLRVSDSGALLAPHAKTSMSPYIGAVQLRAGAWALTVADLQQARVFATAGVRRLLVANEVADPAELRWLVQELRRTPDLEVLVCVDSQAGIEILDRSLAGLERPLPVLVELGFPGGRGGALGITAAQQIAEAVGESGHLLLAGVTLL